MPRSAKPAKTMLALRVDAELKARLEQLAERERRSLTAQVELVLEAGLRVLEDPAKSGTG